MLDIEHRDGIAIIHMRRSTNRLDTGLLRRLAAAFEFVRNSKAVVLTGHGDTFAVSPEHDSADDRLVAEQAAMLAVLRHPRPVVAAVNGDALDAGFALAAAADVRVMAKGLIGMTRPVGFGLTAQSREIVVRLAGSFADSIMESPRVFSPRAAALLDLVERACPPTVLLDIALARAEQLSAAGKREPMPLR